MLAMAIVFGVVGVLSSASWTAVTTFMPQTGSDPGQSRLSALAGQFGFSLGGVQPGQSPEFYADLVQSREVLHAIATEEYEVTVDGTRSRSTLAELRNLEEDSEDEHGAEKNLARVVRWLSREALAVSADGETGMVRVAVTTDWPEVSAAIAVTLVELVNDFNMRTRQTQAAAERRFIEDRVERAQQDLLQSENSLQAFLQNNRTFEGSPDLAFQHDRLERQVAMRQQVYTTLIQSFEQARIDEVRNTPVITVIEEAQRPVLPNPRRLRLKVLLGAALGLLLGIAVATGREAFGRQTVAGDPGIREVLGEWEGVRKEAGRVAVRLGIGARARRD